jgi:hypothetical protein
MKRTKSSVYDRKSGEKWTLPVVGDVIAVLDVIPTIFEAG